MGLKEGKCKMQSNRSFYQPGTAGERFSRERAEFQWSGLLVGKVGPK